MENYEQASIDFLDNTGTTLMITHKGYGKHFQEDKQPRHIFRCELSKGRNSYSFDFGQSIASGSKKPTEYDILSCLTKNDPGDFEDFCGDFGYDPYEKESKRTYKESKRTHKALIKEYEGVSRIWDSEELELLMEIE
jgi:hypothetical protein